jgi:chlorobactene glucosyltransferase
MVTRRLWRNLRYLRWARQQAAKPHAHPHISVLVPARNEASTITPCITSLLQQEYPNYEIVVLNDGSTDSTGAQLDAIAADNPQLRVIHAADALPPGWNGKSYACHRLAQVARGEWMLFTDADTVHSPHSIELGMAQALALGADLVSAFPQQVTVTWSERVFVSFILDFLPLIGLDFSAISHATGSHSAGNGQYLLAHSGAYRAVGGHAAVYDETLDDFTLARHFRLRGLKIALISGREMVRCRMYRSAHAVWEGFSRSLMHGLDNSTTTRHTVWWAMLFAWSYGSLFVNTFTMAIIGPFRWLALVEIAWLALLRAWANRYLQRSIFEAMTTPLAAWGVMALGLSALYRRWQGQKIDWKGRYYLG